MDNEQQYTSCTYTPRSKREICAKKPESIRPPTSYVDPGDGVHFVIGGVLSDMDG